MPTLHFYIHRQDLFHGSVFLDKLKEKLVYTGAKYSNSLHEEVTHIIVPVALPSSLLSKGDLIFNMDCQWLKQVKDPAALRKEIIKECQEFDVKLWPILKLENLLSRLAKTHTTLLGTYLNREKISVNRSAFLNVQRNSEFKYFPYNSRYVLVQDSGGHFRPIGHKEYTDSGPKTTTLWPTINFKSQIGRCAVEPYKFEPVHTEHAPINADKKSNFKVPGMAFYSRAGYCENCSVKYDEYCEHVVSFQHFESTQDQSLYISLDRLFTRLSRPKLGVLNMRPRPVIDLDSPGEDYPSDQLFEEYNPELESSHRFISEVGGENFSGQYTTSINMGPSDYADASLLLTDAAREQFGVKLAQAAVEMKDPCQHNARMMRLFLENMPDFCPLEETRDPDGDGETFQKKDILKFGMGIAFSSLIAAQRLSGVPVLGHNDVALLDADNLPLTIDRVKKSLREFSVDEACAEERTAGKSVVRYSTPQPRKVDLYSTAAIVGSKAVPSRRSISGTPFKVPRPGLGLTNTLQTSAACALKVLGKMEAAGAGSFVVARRPGFAMSANKESTAGSNDANTAKAGPLEAEDQPAGSAVSKQQNSKGDLFSTGSSLSEHDESYDLQNEIDGEEPCERECSKSDEISKTRRQASGKPMAAEPIKPLHEVDGQIIRRSARRTEAVAYRDAENCAPAEAMKSNSKTSATAQWVKELRAFPREDEYGPDDSETLQSPGKNKKRTRGLSVNLVGRKLRRR